MVAVGWLVTFLATMVGLTLLRGFVLVQLWGWFLVPIGVPRIGMALALGISVITGMLCQSPMTATREPKADTAVGKLVEALVIGVAAPLLAWGMGAIIAAFM